MLLHYPSSSSSSSSSSAVPLQPPHPLSLTLLLLLMTLMGMALNAVESAHDASIYVIASALIHATMLLYLPIDNLEGKPQFIEPRGSISPVIKKTFQSSLANGIEVTGENAARELTSTAYTWTGAAPEYICGWVLACFHIALMALSLDRFTRAEQAHMRIRRRPLWYRFAPWYEKKKNIGEKKKKRK